VLVTLQYRLGPLGFLSTEDKTAPGQINTRVAEPNHFYAVPEPGNN
jgi:hypothetical protein